MAAQAAIGLVSMSKMRWCSPALLNIAMMCEIAEGPVDSEGIDGASTAYCLRFIY